MRRFLPFLALALTSTAVFAQPPAQDNPGAANPGTGQPAAARRPMWRANMPGGTYEIVIGAMVSVSSHEYVVDGMARVTEVNVDNTGQLAVRFYYIEPITQSGPAGLGVNSAAKVQSLLTEAAERSGTDAWKKVVKSYPTTTHARTVEYRVANRDALNKVFSSASKSLRTGQPDEVTISE